MEPIVIVDEFEHPHWTHIINVEDLACYHGRTVPELMLYLKNTLRSAHIYENRIRGAYNRTIIKTALIAMAFLE